MQQGKIEKVVGPLVVASGMGSAKMYELVKVSNQKLMGEVIQLKGDLAYIQVYEDTAGVEPDEPVYLTEDVMTMELAPGLMQQIYDGVGRPLNIIEELTKSVYIQRGVEVPSIDREKKWNFEAKKQAGDLLKEGDILGEVEETSLIKHKIMVPPGIKGKLISIEKGEKTIEETIAIIETEQGEKKEISMLQKWPIRKPRPFKAKMVPSTPLIIGTRTIDTFFPLVKGAAACVPGPFGAGKTVIQQAIAKYCDAEVIIYIGCGERGNEMTEVLKEFPELEDPNTGESLMKRTVLIANTSNMPVAAREASIYVGTTIGEYYRDMGYDVAIMADSTSRWAEAMREISGRLEEMPGEEGYPAYLGSRTSQFYERAGYVKTLGSEKNKGSLTIIGAVSPPGGDLSEPVTQNTLRVTKTFWGLDAQLAYKRHFPAINWLNSYSLYVENLKKWWKKNIANDFIKLREDALMILQEEARLEEVVRLVGLEALSSKERLIMLVAQSIREDFLFQNAFDKDDAFNPPKKIYQILKTIMTVYYSTLPIIEENKEFEFKELLKIEVLKELPRVKEIEPDNLEKFKEVQTKIKQALNDLK
jgi:V/A-type H+-transporting ATPase subunit A